MTILRRVISQGVNAIYLTIVHFSTLKEYSNTVESET